MVLVSVVFHVEILKGCTSQGLPCAVKRTEGICFVNKNRAMDNWMVRSGQQAGVEVYTVPRMQAHFHGLICHNSIFASTLIRLDPQVAKLKAFGDMQMENQSGML